MWLWLRNSGNILKAIEFDTLNRWIVWCLNYVSINLFFFKWCFWNPRLFSSYSLLFPSKKWGGVVFSLSCCWCLLMNEWWIKRQSGHTTEHLLLAKMLSTGTGYTFALETTKTNPYKIYETKVFKKLDIKQWRTVIPEVRNKWGEAYNCLNLLPLQSFWARHRERKPKQSSADSLSWGAGAKSPGKPRQLEFQWEHQKWELHKEKSCQALQRVPCIFIQGMISTCKGKLPRLGGKHIQKH